MSAEQTRLEQALANQLVAISVSDSPDLGRLGLLERNLRQTVAAIVTRLVSHGARIAYGGNLDQKGYTYQLYPSIAQAYATAALRSARPPFVHYVAAYLAQDPNQVAAHINAVSSFAEVRLVDSERRVIDIVGAGNKLFVRTPAGEFPLGEQGAARAFLADSRPRSAGQAADLDAMRTAMEDEVTARIIIGGRVSGYAGSRPGILQEALLALQRNHSVFPLGGFGGAARDLAIALRLLPGEAALKHAEVGPRYWETIEEIGRFAGPYGEFAKMSGSWDDLVRAARAEDPEEASQCLLRGLMRVSMAVAVSTAVARPNASPEVRYSTDESA